MNLFATSSDPIGIAHNLDNKRLGSQLMECNHMLSLAVKVHNPDYDMSWVGDGGLVRGMSHLNHPVSIWVRENQQNFLFTVAVAKAVGLEIAYRYGTHHASLDRTDFIEGQEMFRFIPEGERTEFQNSARHAGRGLDFTHLPVIDAYRAYISARWKTDSREPTWGLRGEPEWRIH